MMPYFNVLRHRYTIRLYIAIAQMYRWVVRRGRRDHNF